MWSAQNDALGQGLFSLMLILKVHVTAPSNSITWPLR
jgi:hypothetical protein